MNRNTSKKGEIRALTGIRGFAATWVVGFHFYTVLALLFPTVGWLFTICFKTGFQGVDLFFILSGFIIAYNYQDKLYPFRIGAFKKFLFARLARIYPVHLATLLACLALYLGARITNVHLNTGMTNWGLKSFLANIVMVHAWTSHPQLNWNFPSWSISCEWLAYLCFPAFAALFALNWSRRALWATVGLLLGCYLYLILNKSGAPHWMFVGIAFDFPMGICLYRLSALRMAGDKCSRFPMPEIIALAICTMMVACSQFNAPSVLMIPLLALMIYSLATSARDPLSHFLACRAACYWGRVSYSLYMTHAVTSMVMVRLLPLATFEGRSLVVRLSVCMIYFAAVGLVAVFVYHLIEEPARRRMRQLMTSGTSNA